MFRGRLKKPLLPEWRYWPGVALLLLIALAVVGFYFAPASIIPPVPQGGPQPPDKKAYEWVWEALFSAAFWTAAFTAALTFSTILLWRETRRLAEGAETQAEDTRKSLAISKQAADAAESGAKNILKSIRPYLHPASLSVACYGYRDQGCTSICFDVDWSLHNSGRSPAVIRYRDVGTIIGEKVYDHSTGTVGFVVHEIIADGTEVRQEKTGQGFGTNDLNNAKNVPVLHFRGIIIYGDLFGVTRKTTFLYRTIQSDCGLDLVPVYHPNYWTDEEITEYTEPITNITHRF